MLRCLCCCLLVLVFFSLVTRSLSSKVKCDAISGNNLCLHYFSHAATFKDAQFECNQRNLSLITVFTKAQQEYLEGFQAKSDPPIIAIWIGLYIENDNLRWSSGYPAVPQIFISNTPKNFEGCAVSNISAGSISTWEFIPCDSKLSFVCSDSPKISYRHQFSDQSNLICPPGYKLFNKNCYLLKEDPANRLTWRKANEQCKASDTSASLVTVTSPMEQDAISVMIAHSSHPVWIGMHIDQGERRWIHGDMINYTNWYPKQIHGIEKPLCTIMHQRPLHLGQWEEVDCSLSVNYICQVTAKTKVSSNSSSISDSSRILAQGACTAGYYEYNNRCYRLYIGEGSEITECGIKLSPYSSDEAAFMRLLLQITPNLTIDRAWTGISLVFDSNSKSKWSYKTENNDSYYASMVHDFYTLSYKSTNLSTSSDNRFCVSINRDSTILDVLPCSLKLPSVCGYHLPNYVHPLPRDNNDSVSYCPNFWVQFENKCFSPIRSVALTWSSAESDCAAASDVELTGKAHLASIHSPRELIFISQLFSGMDVWIGLRTHYEFAKNKSLPFNKSSFYWSDDTPVDYLSFASGEPSRHFSNGDIERCFISHSRTHDWNDVGCNSRHLYFCQVTLKGVTPSSSSVPKHDHLPKVINEEICTTISDELYCIRYISHMATFFVADYACRNYNMTLATVPSEEHQKFIMNTLKQKTSHSNLSHAYIGLHNSYGKLSWTSSYEAIPFSFWQPEFQNANKKCTYVDTKIDGLETWGSIPCTEPLPYICSTDMSSRTKLSIQEAYDSLELLNCPAGFALISGSCFMVKANESEAVDWSTASTSCERLHPGAHLATVLSFEQQDGLTVLMGSGRKLSAWIGLHSQRNIHTWINQQKVLYTNWRPTEPNTNGSSCVIMHHELDLIGTWSDEPCDKKFGYICETKPTKKSYKSNVTQLLGMLEHGACLPEFYMFNNSCYSVVSPQNSQRSITDFRDEISGHCLLSSHATSMNCFTHSEFVGTIYCPVIATPHSPVEAAFIRLLSRTISPTSQHVWVGLKVNHTRTSSHLLSEDNSLHATTNLIDFSGLLQQQENKILKNPSNNNANNHFYDCFTMPVHDGNLMRMVNCSMHLQSICTYTLDKSRLSTSNMQSVNSLPSCPKGWISFKENCYWLPSFRVRMNWSDAEHVCQDSANSIISQSLSNSHLASVHSSEELQFLINISLSSSFWIGLKAFYSGTKPSSSVILAWSDASVMNFSVFSSTDTSTTLLNLMENPENCISVNTGDQYQRYTWNVNNCMDEKSFICQMPKLSLLQHRTTVTNETREYKSPHTTTTTATTCINDLFPLPSKSGPYCYSSLLSDALDWSNAESTCRRMHLNAHLVSIHSNAELDEITEIIRHGSQPMRTIWIGLYESNFAYKWSDQSDTDYIPVSADISKESRHYMQDCFVLDSGGNSTIQWKATPCSKQSMGFICRMNLNSSTITSLHPTTFDPSMTLKCPLGFRFYRDRCFQLVVNKLTWSEANDNCHHILKPYPNYNGSLARIDNEFDQQFLASLLDNLEPEKASAVWIGLYRNLSHDSHSYNWSDGRKPKFIKPIMRDHQLSIYGETFASRPSISLKRKSVTLCTSMFRSTDPRLNGLWLQWSCDEPIYLSSLCQATPVYLDSRVYQTSPSPSYRTESFYCPLNFQLGTTGLLEIKGQSIEKLSQPMCYRVFNHVTKMDWISSNIACKNLSTSTYNVSALTVASVFEASFLRTWLHQPREANGGGLPVDEAVWTALKVSTTCPRCYSNWTWQTYDDEPVRYTDWYKSPGKNPGGCYLFQQAPYTTENNPIDSGLGSLQLSSSCETHHFVVCQTLALTSTPKLPNYQRALPLANVPPLHHQIVRPDCIKPNLKISKFQHNALYDAKIIHSSTGKQCVRWDLIDHNFTEVALDFNFIRNYLLAAETVHGGSSTYSYAENYCSHIHDEKSQSTKFGCYININPPIFENCSLITCQNSLPTIGSSVHWFSAILLFLFITFCCVFAIYLLRRIGLYKCIKIRRRYQPFDRHRTSRKRKTTLYLGNPTSTTDIVNYNDNNINRDGSSISYEIPDSFLSLPVTASAEPVKKKDDNLISLQVSGPRKLSTTLNSSTSHDKFTLSALNLSRTAASIYVPLNDAYVDDDYDPEPVS
ncbi:C-type mannose receptor 2 isoform 2 [Schistosoma japonicum]|uniref:C-type mannose receptor 2 isoform 2 n=2 Tax=Schistosoma japonicum TaxID=6182 RepID=A0A4Z2CTS0_SCHJA|nr:C-type mannose receptor 2 isoform 2 [Schistosoma japonicum]